MKLSFLRRVSSSLGVAALSCLVFPPVSASAKNVVSIYAPSSKGQSLPQQCADQADFTGAVFNKYSFIDGWKVYVACDEQGWKQMMTVLGLLKYADIVYGATDHQTKTIILHGTYLLNGARDYQGKLVSGEHMILHEMAHAKLDTTDEDRAEHQAEKWERAKMPVMAVGN